MAANKFETIRLSEALVKVSNPVQVEPKQIYREIGIRSHGKGIFYKDAVTGDQIGNKNVFWVEPDCFILNIVFAWERAVARTTAKDRGFIASHRFPMFKVNSSKFDLDFLTSFFKTERGKYLLNLASPGGAGRNKTLGQDNFLKLEIPAPPVAEQRKISEILSTWDSAIEKLSLLIETKEKREKYVLEQAFAGIVSKQRFKRLDELAEIIPSNVDKKSVEGETEVRLCNYVDVYKNSKITRTLDFMSATATSAQIEKYTVRKNDVIITKDSETPQDIAIPAFVAEDIDKLVCGYHLTVIRCNPTELLGHYLYYYFLTGRSKYYFFVMANGATRFGLSLEAVKSCSIPVPDLPTQRKIVAALEALEREIEILMLYRDSLFRQKRGLVQQLLSGKKRVLVSANNEISAWDDASTARTSTAIKTHQEHRTLMGKEEK